MAVVVCAVMLGGAARADEPPVDVWIDADVRSPTEPLRDPTAASFVLDERDLDRPGRSTSDALARVPGVEVTRAGGGADLATASLRGATSAQTPIHLAGIRLNDDLTGTADLSTLPLWLVRRIEIDRGNAPASADRLGLGGAIFFEPIRPRRPLARASFGMGSFDHRELRAAAAVGDEHASALVAVRHESARDDYEFIDDRGTRFNPSDDVLTRRVNADHRQVDAWVIGQWSAPGTSIRALANALSREQGAPGLQVVPATQARASLQRGLGGVAGEHACGGRGCAVEWAVDGLVTRYHLDDPLRELGGASSIDNSGERSRQRVRVRAQPRTGVALSVGTAQEVQHLSVLQDLSSVSARRHVLHGDVEGLFSVGSRADLLAIAALDCHSTSANAGTEPCGILAPSARVGMRVRWLDWLDVFGNAGRYVREPTLGELYGISSALRGNADLRPETGQGVDFGVSARGRRGQAEGYLQVDGFARWSDDLIAFRRSSFGAVRPYNVGSARVLGVEAAAGASLGHWLRGALALTWLDPRDTSAGRQAINDFLPFRSRWVVSPSLEARAKGMRRIGLEDVGATLRWLYRSARAADPAGLVVLAELSQFDLEFDATFMRHAALRARVSNLLDTRTYDLLGYPLPGRAAYANVELRW